MMTKISAFQNAAAIISTFKINQRVIHRNTKDITQADSLVQIKPAGNCLNWVIGHILSSRNGMFKYLKLEPFWSDENEELYTFGSKAIDKNSKSLKLEDMLKTYDQSQKTLEAALEKLSDDDLKFEIDDKGTTVGQKLAFLAWHEGYHAGQTAINRRVAGFEGAI